MLSIIRLIRLPNLIIIALTLYSFRELVIAPYYTMSGISFQLDSLNFALMVAITMMIALAGYVINDYYDVEIDRINRPDRMVFTGGSENGTFRVIAIILSLFALTGMLFLGFRMNNLVPTLILCVALLTVWWYAIRLKKSLLWGNLAVAFMSSLTLGMSWFFEWLMIRKAGLDFYEIKPLTQIATGITVFAFMLSLIREIVKDLEDRKGDEQFGCRSLPVVKGDAFTRRMVKGLTLVLFVLLVFAQYRLAGMYFPLVIGWLIVFVEIPLLIFFFRFHKAGSSRTYHSCSTFLKWIMVGGILSMVIIRINFSL